MAVPPRSSNGSAKKVTKEIREWAIGEGLEVSSRGRIPAEIVRTFHDAQAKKIQVIAVPAKKAPAKKAPAKKVAASTAPVGQAPAKKTAAVEKVVAEKTPAKKVTKEIREWAIREGLEVSSRGRIPAEIVRDFHDAQARKVQVKAAPARKAAAKKIVAKNAPAKKVAASTAPVSKAPAKKTAAVEKVVAEKTPAKGAVVSKAPAKKRSKEIREWAVGEGHEVSSRGRISVEIERAFHEAEVKAPAAVG
ncbi:hypothetical protein EEB14_56890 [Rhodococcus sp. WS4]|nr:hypothetical protein EEB14_56890 [Rhodococcus sp. WS4]